MVLKATVLQVLSCNFQHLYLNLFDIIPKGFKLIGFQIKKLLSKRKVELEMLHADLLFALTLKASEPANRPL